MEIRKLGTYLIENKSCDDEIINAALYRQLALERKGVYKPLGEILIEIGGFKLHHQPQIQSQAQHSLFYP